jgi:membrane fusion protein, multidrug efflux system
MNYLSLCALSMACLLSGCSGKKSQPPASAAPDSVGVFILKKESITKNLLLPAELHPLERAEIYAKVEGYVRELRVDIGDHVRRNEILVILDAPEVIANYARAYADLQSVQSIYWTSLDNYHRIINATKEKGTVSESELERARNQMLSDSSAFIAARSEADARAQLKNYLVIKAPFDGVITQRNVDPGTLVGGQKILLVLENISMLRVDVALPEAYTSAVLDSSVISFVVDAQPSRKYSATFARKSNQIDPKTRSELWEFEYVNSDMALKAGMYGNASIILHRSQPSFAVPYSAVVTNLEQNFFIRLRDGKAEWIPVRNGISLKDKAEVFGDLHEGDILITKASDEIKEKTPLLPRY